MATRILVVDDEVDMPDLILEKFRKEVKQKEYEFFFAGNGKEALEQLKKIDQISLMLLDINMQVMDGLTFLRKVNVFDRPLLKTIIISAYDDMKNIRSAMNLGAFDFVTKPIDFKDLKTTIARCLDERRILENALDDHKEIEEAAISQLLTLPNIFPAFPDRLEFDIHACMIPAKTIGGDLYDFFFIDKHRFAIVVGDVAGKGLRAAVFMNTIKTILKQTAETGVNTDTCLKKVNHCLCKYSSSFVSVTVLYGILDTRDGIFEYCSGGHNPIYLLSADGKVTQLENVGGIPLGFFAEESYDSKRLNLTHGDAVFVYTDGVTEAIGSDDQEFSEGRLMQCLQNLQNLPAEKITSKVITEVNAFSKNKQYDDITCLALRYFGKPGKE